MHRLSQHLARHFVEAKVEHAHQMIDEKTHEAKISRWIGHGRQGIEVGAGSTPVPGLVPAPVYIDCFEEFGSMRCTADYFGTACELPIHNNAIDYVISSHVLEHVANPVAALAEWYRVLRPDGIIYLVVPDRRLTWDRERALTTVEHMLADYEDGTTAADATHIDDFVEHVIWSEWCPSISPTEVPEKKKEISRILHEKVARGEEINLHFHTFEPSNIQDLFEKLVTWKVRRFHWHVVDVAEHFPSSNPIGILAVVRVEKTYRDRADADWFQVRNERDPGAVFRPDAVSFVEWKKRMHSTA